MALRRRQRLNLLATLLLSQGTPLILGGDELGNSQGGNNNAYAQDNAIGWLDWEGLQSDQLFTDQVRELIWLRRETPLIHLQEFLHGNLETGDSIIEINWFKPDGNAMQDDDWASAQAFGMIVYEEKTGVPTSAVAKMINRTEAPVTFRVPAIDTIIVWNVAFSTCAETRVHGRKITLPALDIALLLAD